MCVIDVQTHLCNQQVGGSNPSTSSTVERRLLHSAFRRSEKLHIRNRLSPLHFETASLGFKMSNSKVNMGEFPSGQRGQTVNLLSMTSVVRIHLPPPIPNTKVFGIFVYSQKKRYISNGKVLNPNG